jgi:hypothetical protein
MMMLEFAEDTRQHGRALLSIRDFSGHIRSYVEAIANRLPALRGKI